MATTVTFDDGSNPAVTVKAPIWPEVPGRSRKVILNRTWGGGRVQTDYGNAAVERHLRLVFRNLTNTHYTNLRTFFETTVNYAGALFTYTDPFGTDLDNMYYRGGLETFEATRGRRWQGTLLISQDLTA